MSYYTNMAGQRFGLPERALKPGDCWREEPSKEKHNEEETET